MVSNQAARQRAADFDVIVIGAGFGGMYMLHRLRQLGLSTRVFEAGDGVGGTWYWNRYPGARCDVESLAYQYNFSAELRREWRWTERYATQDEILRYANHVADRLDLRRDIQFETRIESARFDDGGGLWQLRTEQGETPRGRYLVTAVGCLSAARVPDFPGLEDYQGEWYHTGWWPHDGVDFSGKRVGIIGTGSSAVQSIPVIARQADHLTVFQRTPNFSVPAQNVPLTGRARAPDPQTSTHQIDFGADMLNSLGSARSASAAEREQKYDAFWEHGGPSFMIAFGDLLFDKEANDTAAEYVRRKIREIVRNPQTAELLCPTDHPIGTKRICVDTGYYETYNRDNVTLVDVRGAPIERITPCGLRTSNAEYELDCIVFATGFDAMTGPLLNIRIQGRNGATLADKWADGPRTYLGLAMADFPNLFTITGPGSPSVLSNMIVSIEQHVDWIADCLTYLEEHGLNRIEARKDAEDGWVQHVNAVADQTLFPQANSWYVGANVPGKPRVFMPYVGGIHTYRQRCDEVAANGYEGFVLGSRTETAS